jgi:hypothetical protein
VTALIKAIDDANKNGQNDTINLPACTYTLTAVHNNTNGPNGLPAITSGITIKGAGATKTIITRAANAVPFRLLHVAPSGTLTLDGVTLTNGLLTSGGGGGLSNAGTAKLTRSTVRDNAILEFTEDFCSWCGAGSGGGIANAGTLTLTDSTVSGNFAAHGGGIGNGGTLTLTRSTVNGNGADDSAGAGTCGGIYTSGTATLTSSSVSGNMGSAYGGGICNSGTLRLLYSSVTDNVVPEGVGAGIAGDVTLGNSIITGNECCWDAPPGYGPGQDNCSDGILTSQGRNLLGADCNQTGEFNPTVWDAYLLDDHTRIFRVTFDATPHWDFMNGVTGLALGAVQGVQDLAVIVRFNEAGRIDARNDNAYKADYPLPYTAGTRYRFRLVVNVAQHTYSVYVTPAGGTEVTLATNYKFRTEQQGVPRLDAWTVYAWQGSHTVTNLTLGAVSAPTWQQLYTDYQNGTFVTSFDAMPYQPLMNGVTGLAFGPVNGVDDLAVIVRFNPYGKIDVRNDNAYKADYTLPYTAGTRYHFRLEVDVAQHTYSVYVTPAGGTEVTLATNYKFRTEQQKVLALDTWALYAWQGSHTVEHFSALGWW